MFRYSRDFNLRFCVKDFPFISSLIMVLTLWPGTGQILRLMRTERFRYILLYFVSALPLRNRMHKKCFTAGLDERSGSNRALQRIV
jgi:hypothetical protein